MAYCTTFFLKSLNFTVFLPILFILEMNYKDKKRKKD